MRFKKIQIKTKVRQPVTALDVHPSGAYLAVGQMHLYRWALPELRQDTIINPKSNRRVIMARYAPNGKALTYCDTAQTLYQYDIDSGKNRRLAIKNPNLAWISYATQANRLA